ncbi:MAG TPA: phosphatase PAP2 family protein [Burkholderiaceae bacterium]|nr:phosphatase PAP2 family protein [Burkholderiaceae bacterium]
MAIDTARSFWSLVTRLGEAQILLPALAAMLLWFTLRLRASAVAVAWVASVGVAALITTVTKVAFIGWGVGYAPLDFTGVSGHAMFAAAVLPLLAAASVSGERARTLGISIGYVVALLIAVSRVTTGAHSVSEAFIGFLLGSMASAWAIAAARLPPTHAPKALIVALALWLFLTPAGAPPSRTHSWVTQLALTLSGREQPYTREMMRLDYMQHRSGAAYRQG